jgi:hypothetical protein
MHLGFVKRTHDMPDLDLIITGPPRLFALACHVNNKAGHFHVEAHIFHIKN